MIRSADIAKARRIQILRSGTALTHPANIAFVLALASAGAVGVPAGPVGAQEIQTGGGAGSDAGSGGAGAAGGLAGGGGGGGYNGFISNGGDGGRGALLGVDAEAGGDGGDDGAYSGGAGGQPGSLDDLSAGGGGGGSGASDYVSAGGGGDDGGDGGLGIVFGGSEVTLHGAATGTDGTDAYGGGGGGGGAIVLNGSGSVRTNNQTVTGGGGGEGMGGGGGGAGIVTVSGGNVFVTGGTVTGGAGGAGYSGGDGGAGVFLHGGGMLDNAGTGSIIGGAGGGTRADGGQGGAGVLANHGEIDNIGVIWGGAGGTAIDGGLGGSGLETYGGTITNQADATISGGAGGGSTALGVNAYRAGHGGAGVVFVDGANDGRLENFGTITGGAGGAVLDEYKVPGTGGIGVVVADDNVTIVNAGKIAGGLSSHIDTGDQVQANAVELDGANNTLELRDGYAFAGDVVARGAGHTLALGGDASPADSFDLGKIVDTGTADATDEFIGFDQLGKTGTSTWALAGDGSGFTGDTTVSEGRLDIAGQLGSGEGIVDYTGGNPDGAATTAVSGAGSAWDLDGNLFIGHSGTGMLNIADGGAVTNSQGIIGYFEDGNGRVAVTGPGSVWSLVSSLQVGREGTGELFIADGGAVVTNHPWTDSIASRVNSTGEMTVTGAGSTWNGTSLAVGYLGTGTLTVDDGGVVSVTENILIASQGGSTGTLNIGAAAGDDAVAAGRIEAAAVAFGDGDGVLVFNHTGNPDGSDHVFAAAINSGAGTATIDQIAGTTTLTGDSSGFNGSTYVSGGMLAVNGTLGGNLDVATGATLGGIGTVGSTSVADGGVLAPGNSIGTLTVDGNLSLSSGSILDYEIGSPGTTPELGSSDRIAVTGDLALNGTLNLAQSGDAGDGTAGFGYYRLMTYGGALSGGGLQIGETSAIVDPASYEIQTGDNNVDLFIATPGDDTLQHWQGGDGVWNTTNLQWLSRDGVIEVAWAGHHAVFKNQPGGFDGGTISVEGTQGFEGLQFVNEGYRLAGDGALETAADGSEIRVLADSAEIGSEITGIGGITKTQDGTLVLSGQNSYQGGTTIAGGTVQISADANLGDAGGGLSLNGGTLQNTVGISTARDVTLNAGDGTFETDSHLTITGVVDGSGTLTKTGANTLTLTGANTYTGGTVISNGEIEATVTGALGTGPVVIGTEPFENDASLSFSDTASASGLQITNHKSVNFRDSSSADNATIVNNASFSFNNNSTAGNADITNNGILDLYGSASAGSAVVTNEGATRFAGSNTADDATIINNAHARVEIANLTADGIGIGSLSGGGDVYLGSKNLTLGGLGQDDAIGGTIVDGQPFGGGNPGGSIVKTGTGTLTLTGDSSYTGGTVINAGTLQIGNGGANGAILGDIEIAPVGALAFNRANDLSFAGALSGSGEIDKNGAGLLELIGNSAAFTGTTNVSDGTLMVNGSIARSSLLDIGTGATLSGSGMVGTTRVADGGTVAPGSSIGTLTVAGDLTLSSGSILDYELGDPGSVDTPGNSDRIAVSGDLDLNGTLDLAQSGDAGDGTAGLGYYRLMSYGGDLSGDGLTVGSHPEIDDAGAFEILTGDGNVDLFIAALGDDTLQHWQGGDGVWNAGNAQWLNRDGDIPVTWAGHHAVFKNQPGGFDGGTITVEGTRGFEGLQFVDEGYRLAGDGALETATDGSEIRVLADSAEIATEITGAGDIAKTGDGTLFYGGDGSGFGGSTTVADGMLSVDGTLGGRLEVETGATLGGSGTVGSTTVAAGGTIAPGNSIGTLTVAGDLSLETGARYAVEVMPDSGDSDLLQVTGHAGLEGGSVAHIGATGNYDLRSSYTILSAEELEGSFDDVTSGFAFLNPDLRYDYDLGTVTLELARNDRAFVSAAQTDNQKATAGSIDSIGFDTGHAVHDAIAQLGDDGALIRASFDALSGEIHASVKSALIEDGRFPREAANDRLRAAFGGPGISGMSVIGFAEGRPAPVAADSSRLAAWGQAFGAWGEFDSDGNAASLDRSSGGFLMGADALVGENWRLGALAGIGHGSFDADDRQSSGSDDNYHFGLYGGTQWNDWSFRSGLAYTRHDIETSRTVAVPGYGRDKLEADYDATSLQAFGELGYRIETAAASYEPFVGLAHLRLKTDGFTERGGEAALHVAEQQTETSFATLGVRATTDIRFEGMNGTLRGMLGWRHAFGDTTPLSRHAFSAGDAFTIAGVPIAEDAAVIEAGIDLDLSDTSRFGLSYQGQFGSGVQESGLKADLKVRF